MIQWFFIIIDKGWIPKWFSEAVDHFQNTWLPDLDDESHSCPRAALFSWAHDTKKAVCVTKPQSVTILICISPALGKINWCFLWFFSL